MQQPNVTADSEAALNPTFWFALLATGSLERAEAS
jgi:hypothetical protein